MNVDDDPRFGGDGIVETAAGGYLVTAEVPTTLAALRESEFYSLRSLRIAANGTPWRSSDTDPTATKAIRDRYEGEMYRRFRALKGAIVESVVDNDAFGLSGRTATNASNADGPAQSLAASQDADINISPAGPNDFDFPADSDKIEQFNSWLDEQVDRGILERAKHDGRDIAASDSWQSTYIRSSYEKGVQHADTAAVNADIIPPDQMLDDVFRATKHVDGAGLIYTRSFSELDAVTQDMAQEMTRELAEGFTQGENPRKIARRVNDRVDKVGLHRGRMIARTETIRAHNEAGINRYEDLGDRVDGVTVVAEHMTAGDDRVCDICESLNGRRFDLEDSRGRIPVHPNCRCTFVPIQNPNQ